MSNFIEHLKSFNRKERYWFLREVVGESAFKLDDKFRKRLGSLIGVGVPEDAYVAMDYHLDWIALALHLAEYGDSGQPILKQEIRAGEQINTNQMDIDALIAFGEGAKTRLVLLEAKMETGWNNPQLQAKVDRLKEIFGHGDHVFDNSVEPHLVLISPSESAGLITSDWPHWMRNPTDRPYWMELPRPQSLRKATRSDAKRIPNKGGRYLNIHS